MFQTFVLCLFMCRLIGVFGYSDEVKSVSVMEGRSVTLHKDVGGLWSLFMIKWMFGRQESVIVEFYTDDKRILIHDDVLDGRLRGRLHVDDQTGSVTISNMRRDDSGLYQMETMSSSRISDGIRVNSYRFNVIVYDDHLPVPVIHNYCLQNPPSSERSSSPSCSLLCSVLNVSHVTLSWYKGNSLLSSISVSDLHTNASLPLEVEYQDTNTYSCVLNNPFTNQTQHLNINEVCQPCSDSVNSCDSAGAVMRLVVSALMGVAAVAALVVLVYDIRSRRAEPNRRSQIISKLTSSRDPGLK